MGNLLPLDAVDDFSLWWNALPYEDKESFRLHGGDETLARFVCSLDSLFNASKSVPRPFDVLRTWQTVAPDDATEIAARTAWEHDATQDLIYRLSRRSMRSARDRLVLKYTALLERMLEETEKDDAPDKLKAAAAAAVAKFLEIADRSEREDREMMLRRSTQRAIERTRALDDDAAPPSKDQLGAFIGVLAKQFGAAELRKHLPKGE